MNICIVGLGWLGTPLAKTFLDNGYTVCGTTRSKSKLIKLEQEGIHTFIYDIMKSDKLTIENMSDVDVLILTVPPINRAEPAFYGKKLNDIVSQFPLKTKVIFTSSTSVYIRDAGVYNESSIDLNTSSPVYQAESKLTKTLDKRLTILRLGGLIGKSRHPVKSIQGKKNVKNPKGLINFVHLNDVISAIQETINQNSFGEIYNIVNPFHPNREQYYTSLIQENKLDPIEFETTDIIIQREINSNKISSKLNFVFSNPINYFNK